MASDRRNTGCCSPLMQTYIIKTLVRHMFVTSASFVFLHKMSCMAQGGCISLVCMVSKHHFSHYRLERLLGLQSLKHVLQKQPTLKCPKLSLRNQSQLSDLLLVSTEGEEISCHKCVLVARSGKRVSCLSSCQLV